MVLGVEKRVRAEHGDTLYSSEEPSRRPFLPMLLITVLLVVVMGGLLATYVNYAISRELQPIRAQLLTQDTREVQAVQALDARVDELVTRMDARLAQVEAIPRQMERMLLDTAMLEIARNVELLRAREAYPPQVQERLNQMQRLANEIRQGAR